MAEESRYRALGGVSEVSPHDWNALVGETGSPFLEWEYLASLEEAGCVGEGTGWRPIPLVERAGEGLVGAAPVYEKSDSMGEFVFDHGWADGAHRAGIAYYPKLVVAVPFTPVRGDRLLVSDQSRGRASMCAALRDLCGRLGASSVHVNFAPERDVEAAVENGFLAREGIQFHWRNLGWRTFDDYLRGLRSKRRHQVRRERHQVADAGVEVRTILGDEPGFPPPDELHELYRSTVDRHFWGMPYLNERFFELLCERWRHRLVVVEARREGQRVAGAINVWKGDALYGRYWGAFEFVPSLHFEVCYYAGIEFCLDRGLDRFEPGAGGDFKRLRGFDPERTWSVHHIEDPRLRHAIARYLDLEVADVDHTADVLELHSALRRDR